MSVSIWQAEDTQPIREVDFLIIGAGLAGCAAAYFAAQAGRSVVITEMRDVALGASSRNAGFMITGPDTYYHRAVEHYGHDNTRELWALSQHGAEAVRAFAAEDSMPGLARSDGALEVSNVDVGDRLIARLQTLGEDFDTEVEGWQVDRVRDVLRTKRYFHGVYYPRAFQVDGPAISVVACLHMHRNPDVVSRRI